MLRGNEVINIDNITNQIINADCMDILKELPDKCIDLILTDPPYGGGGGQLAKSEKKPFRGLV